jgi:hypothetical protein
MIVQIAYASTIPQRVLNCSVSNCQAWSLLPSTLT